MIIKYDDLSKIRLDNKNCIIGLFKGTFDLFHYSHLLCLNEIKSNVDILVVEIKSDKDVKKKKGKTRPIISELQRAYIVDNIKSVDYTIIANKTETTDFILKLIEKEIYSDEEIYKIKRDGYLIEKLNPDYVFTTNEKPVPNIIIDLCKQLNIKLNVFPMQEGLHTTDIIKKCKES